jgi:hypothetical protein
MDYNSLNTLLNSLEVNETDVKVHKPILTQLERDINLKSNSVMNLELANPQRQSMNNNMESSKDNMNEKLKDYNFIQTKKYDENLEINFKK